MVFHLCLTWNRISNFDTPMNIFPFGPSVPLTNQRRCNKFYCTILYYLLKPIVETQQFNLYKYIHIYTLHKTFRVIIFFFVSAFILWISMLYFCFFNNKNIRPLIRINWERRNIERLPHHLVKSHVI